MGKPWETRSRLVGGHAHPGLSRIRQAARRLPAAQIRSAASEAARRGRRQFALLVPLLAGVIVAYGYRKQLLGVDEPVRIAVAAILILLGWGSVARNVGRLLQPWFDRRLEPGTAGMTGFVVQLATLPPRPLLGCAWRASTPARWPPAPASPRS